MIIDFILRLPHTLRRHDSIMIVLVHFSKMTHFILFFKTSDASHVAHLYFNKVVHLHGLAKSILSNRDVHFLLLSSSNQQSNQDCQKEFRKSSIIFG